MASIGEITATLRAETSQFQRGMQQAQRPLKVLKRELADVTAILRLEQQALAEGRVTAARAARNIEALTAKQHALRAAITAATTAGKQQAAVLKNVNPYRYAGSGLNMVRSGMSQMAVMALGTRSALGQVGQGLLLMGPGAAWTIAAAAGLTAIGFAFSKLTEKARDAKKEMKRTIEEATRAILRAQPALAFEPKIAAAKAVERAAAAKVAEIQANPTKVITTFTKAGRAIQDVVQRTDELQKAQRELDEAIVHTVALQKLYKDATAAVATSTGRQADAVAGAVRALELQAAVLGKTEREATLYTLAQEGAGKALLGRADAALAAIEAEGRFRDALKANAALIKAESDAFRQSATERARFAEQSRQRFLTDRQRMRQEIAGQRGLVGTDISQEEFLRRRQQIVDEYTQVAQRASRVMRDVMGEVGVRSGQLFVRGFLRGILDNAENLTEVLKRILADILESIAAATSESFLKKLFKVGVGAAAGAATGGPAGAAAGAAGGAAGAVGNISANAMAAMGGGVTVNIDLARLKAPMSQAQQARDAEWLGLLQESFRVAHTQGIRWPGGRSR